MSNPIEKSRRNQSLGKNDVTNDSSQTVDDTNRARRSKAGDFSTSEMSAKTPGGYAQSRINE